MYSFLIKHVIITDGVNKGWHHLSAAVASKGACRPLFDIHLINTHYTSVARELQSEKLISHWSGEALEWHGAVEISTSGAVIVFGKTAKGYYLK